MHFHLVHYHQGIKFHCHRRKRPQEFSQNRSSTTKVTQETCNKHLFFDKNKMIFIHSNREIVSFNIAKNVKDESVNNSHHPNEHRKNTENQTTPHKTTNNKPPHLDDEITKKNLDLCENHLFRLK
ncbi:hypothetical protein MTR_2g011510 [Medicago truncatula]|uniref:Uncharacterized protein n=1 Tax=Medicago truncatula TaxID=3880 RepID=A0A072VE98_MEDTR|nr:hypothetical protein MTR_2g011510 [Medicago truncatula]